jgi:endonuclease YncB( thermonuclease family)
VLGLWQPEGRGRYEVIILEALILIAVVVAVFALLAKGSSSGSAHRSRGNRKTVIRASKTTIVQRLTVVQAGPTPAHSAINAPVLQGAAYIIDGDSLKICKTEVRLFGVDAPEMNHPYGKQAKWALFNMCKGHQVRAEVVETDAHGRTVAKCYLPDGRDLSAEMVKLGLAIDWPKFSGGKYKVLEVENARRKMWLADARQKGHMHLWQRFDAAQRQNNETLSENP